MEIITGLDVTIQGDSAVSLGKFDGIHLGHRLLLQQITGVSKLCPTVFTFDFHEMYQSRNIEEKKIYTEEEKQDLLKQLGIQREILFPFTEQTRCMEAKDFIQNILVKQLHAKFICVGEDYRFGKDRAGDVTLLDKYSNLYGYQLKIMKKLTADGDVISSTRIRSLLEEGRIQKVNQYLGQPYHIRGKVVHGNALGRTIGMPTANVVPDSQKILPPFGVYATTATVFGKTYQGVSNLGKKPTVGSDCTILETTLFDFSEEIYGEEISVNFIQFLRPERKFSSVEELKNQLQKDKNIAKTVFSAT